MNDRHIETLLQSLPPAAASPALKQRIQHELDLDMQWLRTTRPQAMPRWLSRVGWGAAGAAAAVAVMSLMIPESPNKEISSSAGFGPAVMPIHTIREIVSTQDDGIQFNALSQLPEQRVKIVSVERHAWTDPRDGAEITVEVPREDNLVLPASFQ